MRLANVHIASVRVHLPEQMSGTEAAALGYYDEDNLVDTGLDGVLVAGEVVPVTDGLREQLDVADPVVSGEP